MAWAWYNENDPFAADWLELLIINDLIAPGYVDRRSVTEVQPDDLREFGQCHFFAGIGGWSLAFRMAGVPDDKPWWSGSCPCQPFSQAGQQKGEADKRHLWPEFRRIIAGARDAERMPASIFGEQVAGAAGREWLSRVRVDLEAMGYAVGAADLCAASVGAPHIRQRLYWVGNTESVGLLRGQSAEREDERRRCSFRQTSQISSRMAEPESEQHDGTGNARRRWDELANGSHDNSRMGDTNNAGLEGRRVYDRAGSDQLSPWAASEIVPCEDGYRRIEPNSSPLAHGLYNRMGRIRGYGNAIVPQVAAEFIRCASA